MPFNFLCHRGVKADIRGAVRRLTHWLPTVSQVRHVIEVEMVPAPAIEADGGFGFGLFVVPARKRQNPTIVIAAGLADVLQEEQGDSREDALLAVRHTFLHEFAHYEQWRDGRELTERGVSVRAAGLLRKIAALTSAE